MAQARAKMQGLKDLKENQKKWSKPVMDAGWSAVPNILIEKQAALGLTPLEMNILLHLIQYWWFESNLPHPSVKTVADAIGVTERTVQRTITRLCALGFMEREERRYTERGSKTNLYSFKGLIEKLKPHAAEKLADRKKRDAEQQARVARKKPSLKLVE